VETDVANKVRQTHVPKTRPLMPVFEAIVNSIHALEDAGAERGEIVVDIVRRTSVAQGEQAVLSSERQPIVGFVIRDNGAGFDAKNYQSFGRAESSYKLTRGGKGIGRFLWLAAFHDVLIDSVYKDEAGTLRRRKFRFSKEVDGGIEVIAHAACEPGAVRGSVIALRDVLPEVSSLKLFPKDSQRVAAEIAEHCTGYLLRPKCPKIRVRDGELDIDVNETFSSSAAIRSRETFEANGHTFHAVVIKARPPSGDTPNRVRLCANYREVKSYSLAEDLPQLPRRMWDSETERRWVADVYVFGDYLDGRVDKERARFHFEEFDSETEDLVPGELSMRALRRHIAAHVSKQLQDFIQPERERWRRAMREHVTKKSPRYNVLFKVAAEALDNITPDTPAERLEGELAQLLFRHRLNVEGELARELESDKPVEERLRRLLGQVHDVQRDQLAEYVLRRHAVIAFMKSALAKDPRTGRRPFESVLHDIVFPRRTDSTEIDADQANLWVLDERLNFGDEVISDQSLDVTDPNAPVPDLLVFDRVVAVADGSTPRNVVIFEFKRPGRDDYSQGPKKDPVGQLQEQVYRIREGAITTPDGRVRRIPESVPIFAYLVADSTPTLIRHLSRAGWIAAADAQTHVFIDTRNRAIYQHLTWQELLDNAAQRHRGFFEKLNLSPP
jgi:hypothetical protein